MTLDEQVFADGIGTISMIGGTVRLDFLAYSPTEMDSSGQPKAQFRQRIIMGLDAFLASAEKIHEAAQALAARTARPETASGEPSRPEPARPEPALRPTLVMPSEPPPEPAPAKPPAKPPFP